MQFSIIIRHIQFGHIAVKNIYLDMYVLSCRQVIVY